MWGSGEIAQAHGKSLLIYMALWTLWTLKENYTAFAWLPALVELPKIRGMAAMAVHILARLARPC
jgi:hypothetical protein